MHHMRWTRPASSRRTLARFETCSSPRTRQSANFFYGINFEVSYATPRFSETRWNMEIRPIIGFRKNEVEFIVNPIVDIGFGTNGDVTFTPAASLARNFGGKFALGIGNYTGLGPL